MTHTRRAILGALAATAALAQTKRPRNWKPKLGILARYSESNLEFARAEGFTSLQLNVGAGLTADAPDDLVAKVKDSVARAGLYVSSLMISENHTAPDPAARAAINARFVKTIELAGKLGVPYVGTMSGNMPGRKLAEQVDEIVRVYTELYFPLCQKHNVKIVWEPWAGGPNIATGPVGYEALFQGFRDSPYVGLLFDPSHLQWQFMDPVQCARDFIGKIWDVHLKDCEILWPVLRRTGINPLNSERWWRFRLPGYGSVDWKGLFTVLQEAAYQGALNIEHEDEFYYPPTTEPSSPNPTNPASAWPTNSCASTCPSSRRGIPIQCCGRVGARLRLAQRLARDQEVLVQVSAPRLSPRLSA